MMHRNDMNFQLAADYSSNTKDSWSVPSSNNNNYEKPKFSISDNGNDNLYYYSPNSSNDSFNFKFTEGLCNMKNCMNNNNSWMTNQSNDSGMFGQKSANSSEESLNSTLSRSYTTRF